MSENYSTRLKAIAQQCGARSTSLLEGMWNKSDIVGPMAPLVHLYSHLSELTTLTMKSLQLIEMQLPSLAIDGWSDSLRHLEHLDIECRITWSRFLDLEEINPDLSMEHARRWRSEIQNLTNLRSLRLKGSDNWKDVYYSRPVHLDDLLQGVELPRLSLLSLTNWPVREVGLAKIIRRHRRTLRTLEFRKISIDVTEMGIDQGAHVAWRRIAAVCSQCCDVERFSFRELKVFNSRPARRAAPLFGADRVQAQLKGLQDYLQIARGLVKYEPTPDSQ